MTITLDAWPPATRTMCADDPEAWFAPNITQGRGGTEQQQRAADLCNGCPFINECLDRALGYERGLPVTMRFGVWGGTLPWERAALEKLRGAA